MASEEYYVYTENEQKELMTHLSSFSLQLRLFIYKNMNQWMDNFEDIEELNDKSEYIKSEIVKIKNLDIRNYLLGLLMIKADNLTDIQYLFRRMALRWRKLNIKKYDGCNFNREYKNCLELLLFQILRYKLNAFDISRQVRFAEKNRLSMKNVINELLDDFKCLCERRDNKNRILDIAAILYLLFHCLELDAFDYKDPFLSYASIENPTDGIKIEKELENAKDDFLSFLNRRKKDSNCFLTKHSLKKEPEENYDTTKISFMKRGKSLFGDNLFDSEEEMKEVMYQVDMMDKSLISSYMGATNPKYISFTLSEEDLCFLSKEYNYKKCVICTKSEIKHCIQGSINGKTNIFLLFRVKGQSSIYGISIFTNQNHKTRILLKFEKDPNVSYELAMDETE